MPFYFPAGRFRQVEVLTAMANAFYSLFSHVSRTPLPKLAAQEPNLALSPVEQLDRFRSEPRSPVERLKDTVSKMCLYTGGAQRDSDSASLLASHRRKRPGLPEVVDFVWENAKLRAPKKLDFLEPSRAHIWRNTGTDVLKQKTGDTGCHKGMGTGALSDVAEYDGAGVESSDLDNSRSVNSVGTWPLSGETTSQRKCWHVSNKADRDRGGSERLVCDAADNSPQGIRVGHDFVFPVIAENSHHHTLVHCSPTDCGEANHLHQVLSGRKTSPVRTCLGPDRYIKTCEPSASRSSRVSMNTSDAEKDCRLDSGDPRLDKYARPGGPTLMHHLLPGSVPPPCCVTVKGWEEDHVTSLAEQGIDHCSNGPKQALRTGTGQLLNPLKHPKLKHISNKLNQANSFEMEEVRFVSC